MAFRQTPQLGPQLDQVGPFHWDGINITEPSPKLGTREHGTDGHVYLLVKASGTIAALSTGHEVIVVPPLLPDVAIIHVQRCDADGNSQIWGIVGEQKEVAFASKHVIITTEEIVTDILNAVEVP